MGPVDSTIIIHLVQTKKSYKLSIALDLQRGAFLSAERAQSKIGPNSQKVEGSRFMQDGDQRESSLQRKIDYP
jgi:hypothetical protein